MSLRQLALKKSPTNRVYNSLLAVQFGDEMSTEDVNKRPSPEKSAEQNVPADNFRRKIRAMRIATAMLTVAALTLAAPLLAAGWTAIVASNIGGVPLGPPLGAMVGLTIVLIIVVGIRTYTSMAHRELLVELQISSSS